MAEALAILGALSSILQIVDFTAKLVSYARELVGTGIDTLKEVKAIEQLAVEYDNLAGVLLRARSVQEAPIASNIPGAKDPVELVPSRRSIINLAEQCHQQAQSILDSIEDLRMTAASNTWKRFPEGSQKALRFMRKKKALKTHLDTLHQTGNLLRLSLQTAAEDKSNAIAKAIIKALTFEAFHQREQIIEEAYPQTYQWALDDESFGIRTWLSSNSSIFWVTGKPGCGKSTFMKYLYKSPRTATYLQQWAQDSRLILARFYFWYLGTTMQTSSEGLLRSILCQVIVEHHELAEIAFPDYFESVDQPFHLPEFVYSDLIAALRRVAAATSKAQTKTKFCFFLDGLDEYRGDYIELVDLLNDVSKRYDIKMLVSSRPWTVFSRAYEGVVPHLRLEDLTNSDIHLYVYNHVLGATSSTQALSQIQLPYEQNQILNLINDVVEKAEGVFLWVFLVVREIRRGVAEGDSVSTLRRRVKSIPRELHKFFKDLIYDRVDQVYASQTCQALMLAMLCVQQKTALSRMVSFLDYWLILRSVDGLADSEFPFQWKPSPMPLTSAQLVKAAQETRQFLSSACKDLLIMERPRLVDEKTEVTFLHRTVYDFLCTDQMHDLLDPGAPECMKSGWILHLLAWAKVNLLRWKLSDVDVVDAALGTLRSEMSEPFVKGLATHIHQHSLLLPQNFSSQVIETLAAYQQTNLIWGYIDSHSGSIEDCIPAALLGLSRLRQFGIEQVDLSLVREAVTNTTSISEIHTPAADTDRCSHNSWQLLLRRLYDVIRMPQGQSSIEEELLWEAAKIYLLAGAPTSQVFCIGPVHPGVPHTHEWFEPGEFLRDHVPPDFRFEGMPCPPTNLVLRTQDHSAEPASEPVDD